MAISTAVHSNAFNFMSYIQSQVDPRTGQYTCAVVLPELHSNKLNGPVVPLGISFNPLNTNNSGMGRGWNMRFSELKKKASDTRGILSLYTGETFAVDFISGEARVSEQKIKSFQVSQLPDGSYRVAHKSGLIEVLKQVDSDYYLASEMLSDKGYRVVLSYRDHHGLQFLDTIADADGVLLQTTHENDSVLHLLMHPETPNAARYTFKMDDGLLTEVLLPAISEDLASRDKPANGERASWRFGYMLYDGGDHKLTCLKTVATPTGGSETIDYWDHQNSHQLPGSSNRLPRVKLHTRAPGFEQPDVKVQYDYASNGHNFLGFNSEISWSNDGLDNLYKIQGSYDYSSVESQLDEHGEKLSITTRTFNKFHLLTEETIDRPAENSSLGFARHETLTDYYIDENKPFSAQPNKCQLPKRVKQSWYFTDRDQPRHEQAVETDYDDHGNLISQTAANGVVETSEWYAATGEDGCPVDPEGFVRTLKSQTTSPSTNEPYVSGAATLVRQYRYEKHDVLAAGVKHASSHWLAKVRETLFEEPAGKARTEKQRIISSYFNDPNDALSFGRVSSEQLTLNDNELHSTTVFRYSESTFAAAEQHRVNPHAGERVLTTESVLTGFDGNTKTLTQQHSLLLNEVLLSHDDNDVQIAYEYDVLRRVTAETVAPGTAYEASRTYSYTLTNTAGQQARQSAIDVKGVETISYLDGHNRVLREARWDADKLGGVLQFRDTYRATYNALEQLLTETSIDWEGESAVPLLTRFNYDQWHAQSSLVRPDGVEEHEVVDPIERTSTQWTVATGESKPKSGRTVTQNNLFDKPDKVRRDFANGDFYSEHLYTYDGIGRTAKEADAVGNETSYTYDCFDRLIVNTLPDNSKVTRAYAAHSSEDLPVEIKVKGKINGTTKEVLLGTQGFDGLGRMIASETGGRRSEYEFDIGQRQPKSVTRPSGATTEYAYRPELGEDPILRSADSVANYHYDELNARLRGTDELDEEGNTHVLSRTYTSTGELATEVRSKILAGATKATSEDTYTMTYTYTRQARLTNYTDVLGQAQTYEYDAAARLLKTTLGSTSATFAYDAFGRNSSIDTIDGAQRLQTVLEYDDFNREVLRRFDLGGGIVQTLEQEYDEVDRLVRRTLSEASKELRSENYSYDERGRLIEYSCTGPQAPVDPYGNTIKTQYFEFDAVDNLTAVGTVFAEDGKSTGADITNWSTYVYENVDPCQLSSIENDQPAYGYPAQLLFDYDADGNLLTDEAGRQLGYDSLGRLISVSQGAEVSTGKEG